MSVIITQGYLDSLIITQGYEPGVMPPVPPTRFIIWCGMTNLMIVWEGETP